MVPELQLVGLSAAPAPGSGARQIENGSLPTPGRLHQVQAPRRARWKEKPVDFKRQDLFGCDRGGATVPHPISPTSLGCAASCRSPPPPRGSARRRHLCVRAQAWPPMTSFTRSPATSPAMRISTSARDPSPSSKGSPWGPTTRGSTVSARVSTPGSPRCRGAWPPQALLRASWRRPGSGPAPRTPPPAAGTPVGAVHPMVPISG